MKNRMFKKAIAVLLCVMTVFGLSPAVFATDNCAVELDYSHNADGDYYYLDDKALLDGTMTRGYIDENVEACSLMMVNCINFMFDNNGKKQIVQMIKGQYGFIFVGGEVGVYSADEDAESYSDFTFADDSEMIDIQLECMWDKDGDGKNEQVFSAPQGEYRYANAFRKGYIQNPSKFRSQIIMKAKFSFDSEETAKSFVEAVKYRYFTEVFDSEYLVSDTFYAEGSTVTVMWESLENALPYAVYTLEKNCIAMAPGKTETVGIVVRGTELRKPEYTFESSDESVATVDENGVVTAVDYGTAEISVRVNGEFSGNCEVTVEDGSVRCIYEKVKASITDFVADYLLKILVFYYR